jgi:hypothetical protein
MKRVLGLEKHSQKVGYGCRWMIGNGKTIDFWFDPWVGHYSLIALLPAQIWVFPLLLSNLVEKCGIWLKRVCPVSVFLILERARHTLFLLRLYSVTISFSEGEDSIFWDYTADGVYTVKSGWEAYRAVGQPFRWAKQLWCPNHSPRAAITLRLVLDNRLNTCDRLKRFGHSLTSEHLPSF